MTIWFLQRKGSAEIYERTHFPKEIDLFYLTLPLNGIILIKIIINLEVSALNLRPHHLALISMSVALSLEMLRRSGTLLLLIKHKESKLLLVKLDPWE